MLKRFTIQKNEEKKKEISLSKEGYKTSNKFHDFLIKKAQENSVKVAEAEKLKSNNLFNKEKIRKMQYKSIARERQKANLTRKDDDSDDSKDSIDNEIQKNLKKNKKLEKQQRQGKHLGRRGGNVAPPAEQEYIEKEKWSSSNRDTGEAGDRSQTPNQNRLRRPTLNMGGLMNKRGSVFGFQQINKGPTSPTLKQKIERSKKS